MNAVMALLRTIGPRRSHQETRKRVLDLRVLVHQVLKAAALVAVHWRSLVAAGVAVTL